MGQRLSSRLLLFLFLLINGILQAQDTNVKGKVINEAGEPVSGASIKNNQ